jgi:hypothetical protein
MPHKIKLLKTTTFLTLFLCGGTLGNFAYYFPIENKLALVEMPTAFHIPAVGG